MACFQGEDPTNVLVSYTMCVYGICSQQDYHSRVKIRYLFDAFCNGMIQVAQLLCLAEAFGPRVSDAARKLITVCSSPDSLRVQPHRQWTVDETLLLISSAAMDIDHDPSHNLPHRSVDAWTKRVKRVVQDLRDSNSLKDLPSLQICVQSACDVTISPSPVLCNERLAQERRMIGKCLLLSKSLAELKRTTSIENARRIKKIQDLQRKLEKIVNCNDGGEIHQVQDMQQTLLAECKELMPVPKHGRRYSTFIYDISELLRATSKKTFRIMRQILPLPSESSLYLEYTSSLRTHKDELTDPKLLRTRIRKLILEEGYHMSPVTIGIDAFSFQTFGATTIPKGAVQEQFSNAFVFLHIPLDPQDPPRVIHLQKKSNGSYDESVSSIFQSIKEIYEDLTVKIWFKATDGDRFLSREHEKFFEDHIAAYENDFTLLLQKLQHELDSGLTLPISDPLHFTKNIRGKLLDHNVAVVEHDGVVEYVNAVRLQSILGLGSVLGDRSTLGRMRDVYVTKLFTLDNVCTLIESKYYAGALLLLPYSCIFTVLYGINLANQTRMFFTKLAYLLCRRLMHESERIVSKMPTIKHRYTTRCKTGCTAVTFAEPTYAKRIMHSCLALGISILFGPDTVRLDAVGTHLVENNIGIARSLSNSTKFSNIVSAFAKTELRKDVARKYGMKLYVHKRINDGGAKVKGELRPDIPSITHHSYK